MSEISTDEVKAYLHQIQGQEIELSDLRREFNIIPGSKSFDAIRVIMFRLADQGIVRPAGKHGGRYKVITQVKPVSVFGVKRELIPPFNLKFPQDREKGIEMFFANDVVVREGDLILISGLSNFGKTTLCMNFCGENIDKGPVLMGNEYTHMVDNEFVPAPRFVNRLNAMSWVSWYDPDTGQDRFTLLPVRDDYAEHIVKDKINIIDWINIETGEHYLIGRIMEDIKRKLGRGIGIIALQKGEGKDAGRGGQFTKDFADLELLIDRLGTGSEVLLTIGKTKEATKPIVGKTYAYTIINQGSTIHNFREVKKCEDCGGHGFKAGKPCITCNCGKYVDK